MIHAWKISAIMVIIYKISAADVAKTPVTSSPVPLPSFLATKTNFTFREGDLARLECSVDNLSTKKVIWRRKSDPNPLTIGRRTFVEDTRVLVEHAPLQREWNLLIKHVRIDDAGMYECQVSSRHKRLRWLVRLNVIRKFRLTSI
ncbi:lachesin-like [Gigantopelta aegis]|uniref:lachesin-like n=1 Tax=Gigantopelta aegis TaxID=1735272 RepID=UPI001B889C0F|nr:lachesin-like [Gigantopelta aegis]